MINHSCPHCHREMSNSDNAAGWEVACPHCRRSVLVPNASTTSASPAAGAANPVESSPETRPPFESDRTPDSSRKWLILGAVPIVAAAVAWLLAGNIVWMLIGIFGCALVAGAVLGMFRRILSGVGPELAELAKMGYGALLLAIWFGVGYWFQTGTVHIDNFNNQDLRVVVDDQEWTTSRANSMEIKSLTPGSHRVTVLGNDNNKLDELNVQVERMGVYVLNLLRAQKYHKGSVEYGGFGFGSDRPTEITDAWFNAKVDFLFEEPPESITISKKRGQPSFGATRTFLKRGPAPSEK